ncbi:MULTISPECIES: ZIP family metal transporter [unclassified Cellulosimicrobium]|uniref:ZIP family metal transporter n=1 Tax=unclassified Cellulosimicrobium TaxID=2624466 RepID=UPI000D33DBD2|nr:MULTISPECIES: ZIP family zinc transporter [Actinomycetes]PTU57418.1 ZIP family zinc transporter [Sphaerisporangium cinnabarinum]
MIGFWWGLVGASSLLLGAALVFWRPPGQRLVGLVMAFGSGVLISAVAYDLVEDASTRASGLVLLAGLAGGALTFFVGDRIIDRMGGEGRKRSTGVQKEAVQAAGGTGGAAIALGTVLDGIPESVVLGATLIGGGGVSVAMLAAVFVSNLPEAMSATAGLLKAGTKPSRLWVLWGSTTLVSALAAGIGYLALDGASPAVVAVTQAFAAGALLTMLVDTMIPEATEFGGPVTGLVTVLGFATAFGLSSIGG